MEIDPGDYALLGENMIYLLKTYRDSVGDIATPSYSVWESLQGDGHIYGERIKMLIWFTWLMN